MVFRARLGDHPTQIDHALLYGPPMAGEPGSAEHIAYYRERAAHARLAAAKTTDEQVRAELLRIAAAFELLAQHKQEHDR